ncbi:hypothetical protein A1OE_939 [Candidatus Endolissoclinum faulkneri L2]|uniref:Uncharacterized protein n=1 Tax=Candidatus Endolissoclinum faulkneri L2 TaxID=1193729 RepID=K7YNL3_9PROT|nr:hypothetical protein A1OE_939 [Candidatus Endolissoclinum faulkneri L2]
MMAKKNNLIIRARSSIEITSLKSYHLNIDCCYIIGLT